MKFTQYYKIDVIGKKVVLFSLEGLAVD